MSRETTNWQCPNCSAPLAFSAVDGEVKCDFCESTFSVEVLEKLYNDTQDTATDETQAGWGDGAPGGAWGEGEEEALQVYTCPSCGAQIISDENTIATSCVYCGNPTTLGGRLSGTLKPDYVIPFRKTKADAIEALNNFYKGKRLLPKVFAAKNHIEEIKGVYVPFWLFDSEVEGQFVFNAQNSRTYRSGDNDITKIDHYRVMRKGRMKFEKIPVDGSEKMEDRFMDAIEPFDYDELVPFSTAYLPGYLADKYDVDADASTERANTRIAGSLETEFGKTIGYDMHELSKKDVRLIEKDAKYALLPVWMLSTRWKDKNYMFAMNGQTGRLIGDLPVSKGRAAAWFVGISGSISAICLAALLLIM